MEEGRGGNVNGLRGVDANGVRIGGKMKIPTGISAATQVPLRESFLFLMVRKFNLKNE